MKKRPDWAKRNDPFRYNGPMTPLWQPALCAFLISLVATPLVALAARRLGIVDRPGGRRVHRRVTPRLGGVALVAAFLAVLWIWLPDIAPHFKSKQLAGFALAAGLLTVVGIIDDRRGVPAIWQLATHVAAGLTLVLVGMGIEQISNPFGGGPILLNQWEAAVTWNGVAYHLTLPADLLTVAWVVLVINAINWLDGLDGLATGVGGIAAGTIALLSVSAVVDQPHVATLALMLTGALAGFLVFNWHPAKVFLGTVGSTFIGFTVATLAIISGGKIATAILVLGFPILDTVAVMLRRRKAGSRPWHPDANHLHHLLLGRGFSVRQAVLAIYVVCATFGLLALAAGTTGAKLLAFVAMAALMAAILAWLSRPKAS